MSKKVSFNNLSDADRDWARQTLFSPDYTIADRIKQVEKKFGIHRRTAWAWRAKFSAEMEEKQSSNPYVQKAAERKITKNGYYIFTWAQNATPVHHPFWENLLAYSAFLDAEIHVIPGRYRNPSLFYKEDAQWWDEDVSPYLNSNRENIHESVQYLGDVKIQPTAVNPMRGFQGIAGDKTAIYGHPKLQLQTMPSLPGHHEGIHLTTGACTIRNYSDTKAGKKGEHHHCFGFTILECYQDEHYYIRQVSAEDSGAFTDLYFHVEDGEVEDIDSCAAFVMGDLHTRNMERGVFDATLSYLDRVKPANVVLHDVLDGESINHHAEKDPFHNYHLHKEGRNCLKTEIEEVESLLTEIVDYHPVLVYSNHCEWIDRWLMRSDWKKDMVNAETYLEYAADYLKHRPEKGFLHHHLDRIFGDNITTLGPNDSFRIEGWETATHGHLGINGARGSMASFRKFNTKVIFGHMHSAARYDGAIQVGTYTKKDLGYNLGPSSWAHCGAVIHNNGKVQQLFFIKDNSDYKFTTFQDITTRAN